MTHRPGPDALSVLVTCEHGGYQIPEAYRGCFDGADEVLASHRGWDPGAWRLARDMATSLSHFRRESLIASTVTRLLVDLNRSAHNPRVFSPWTRALPREERERLLAAYHRPHRVAVDEAVTRGRGGGTVVHLGVHSFTPVLQAAVRRPDLALLYDPRRPSERLLCAAWVRALKARLPGLAVHRNDPYRGASDGLTTWLRGRHGDDGYLGIEVEVNQRLLDGRGRFPPLVAQALTEALGVALEEVSTAIGSGNGVGPGRGD